MMMYPSHQVWKMAPNAPAIPQHSKTTADATSAAPAMAPTMPSTA